MSMGQRSASTDRYRKKDMSRPRSDDNSVLLVHAYLDGELDPANALSLSQKISQEPALAAEAERVKELQKLIHDRLPREAAPPPQKPAAA